MAKQISQALNYVFGWFEALSCVSFFFEKLSLSLVYLTQTLEYWNIFQSLDESLHHFLNENQNKWVLFFPTFSCKKSTLILLPSNLLWLFFTIIFKIGNDSWEEIFCVTVIYNISFTWDGPYKDEEEVYHVCYYTDIWVFSLTNCEREDSYIRVYFSQIWDSPHVNWDLVRERTHISGYIFPKYETPRMWIEIEVTNLHHSKYRLVEPKPLKAWIEIEVTNLHHSKYRLVEPKPLKAWSCSKMFTSLSFPRDFRILPFKIKYL